MISLRTVCCLWVTALAVAGPAFAGDPVPSLRLQHPPAAERAAPPEGATAVAVPAPGHSGSQTAQLPAVVRGNVMQAGPVRQPVGRDRFGNPIFGDRCEDHWANCAYDPYRNNPQISQAPDTNR